MLSGVILYLIFYQDFRLNIVVILSGKINMRRNTKSVFKLILSCLMVVALTTVCFKIIRPWTISEIGYFDRPQYSAVRLKSILFSFRYFNFIHFSADERESRLARLR
jgi:hypothetical protein